MTDGVLAQALLTRLRAEGICDAVAIDLIRYCIAYRHRTN